MATASFLAGHLAVLMALSLMAGALGCVVLRTIACSRLERWVFGGALGLGVLGQAALLLGLCGALRRGPVAALAALALVGCWCSRRAPAGDGAPEATRPRRRQVAVGLALAAAALTPLFLAALYPPTAFDETLYHLPTARAFAESGEVRFLSDLRVPVFAQLGDLLMATVLLWSGETATHLVALLATLLTAGLLAVWGRRLGRPLAGACAAALFLGNPVVVYLAGTGYIEPELALFITGAMFAADRWREARDPRWLVAAAFLAGCAASTKYLGLPFVAVVALWPLLYAPHGRRGRDTSLALLVAAAAMAPTYARLVYWTGNPVFPFLPEVFGTSPWASLEATAAGPWQRLRSSVTLPWDVVFRRVAAGWMPPHSPLYLLGLPLLAIGGWTMPWVRRMILLCAAYLLVAPANARYAVAVLPLASLALAVAGAGILDRVPRQALRSRVSAWTLCVLLFLPGWLYAGYELRRGGPLPVTATAREAYLLARLPVYPAIRYLNQTRGERYVAYQVGAEQMLYFARGRLLGDHTGPASYAKLLTGAPDAEAVIQRLRGWGVDHLVVAREARRVLPGDPATWHGVRRVYSDAHAEVFELPADPPRRASNARQRSSNRGVIADQS